MLADFQECPHCGSAINREHFAREPLTGTDKEVTYLYCEFCDFGIETLWTVRGGSHHEDFSLEYGTRDQTKLGMFLQRLRDRRAA